MITRPWILFLITLILAGCGVVEFGNTQINGDRVHNRPRVDIGEIEFENVNVVRTDANGLTVAGPIEFDIEDSYQAKLKAKSELTTDQRGISATSGVKVDLAVSKYLSAMLTGGASAPVTDLVEAAAFKVSHSMATTPVEEFAVAATPNAINGNVSPTTGTIKAAIGRLLKSSAPDAAKAAATELSTELDKIIAAEAGK